jgi:hypothetical protein
VSTPKPELYSQARPPSLKRIVSRGDPPPGRVPFARKQNEARVTSAGSAGGSTMRRAP